MLTYDAGQPGITLAVTLKAVGDDVACEAKIDTGSFYCVFARGSDSTWKPGWISLSAP